MGTLGLAWYFLALRFLVCPMKVNADFLVFNKGRILCLQEGLQSSVLVILVAMPGWLPRGWMK